MSKKEVIYIGNFWKVAEYILFHENFMLRGIICEEDRVSDELYTFSLVRNIDTYTVKDTEQLIERMEKFGKNVIFITCSFGRRIPAEKFIGWEIYNIHYADLPYYKGRHPTYWATVCNEKIIGISIHIVTQKFDEGDIIAQEYVPYYLWENEEKLFEKLTERIPALLNGLVGYLKSGVFIKKNFSGEYYHPVSDEETYINIEKDSPAKIFNKVRSQARCGGAKIRLGSQIYHIRDVLFTREEIDDAYVLIEGVMYVKCCHGVVMRCTDFYKEDSE